eukprot:COSAG06_NODE_3367_length_5442_cov_3.104810_5_plen_82_part_00
MGGVEEFARGQRNVVVLLEPLHTAARCNLRCSAMLHDAAGDTVCIDMLTWLGVITCGRDIHLEPTPSCLNYSPPTVRSTPQ